MESGRGKEGVCFPAFLIPEHFFFKIMYCKKKKKENKPIETQEGMLNIFIL